MIWLPSSGTIDLIDLVVDIMEAWNGLHLNRRISDEFTGYMFLQGASLWRTFGNNEIDKTNLIRSSPGVLRTMHGIRVYDRL